MHSLNKGNKNFFPHLFLAFYLLPVLTNIVATSHMWLFKCKLIKITQYSKISYSVTLDTFQMLNSPMWLVATMMDGADRKHYYHYRKFFWTMLIWIFVKVLLQLFFPPIFFNLSFNYI